jgi:hypothetical protein
MTVSGTFHLQHSEILIRRSDVGKKTAGIAYVPDIFLNSSSYQGRFSIAVIIVASVLNVVQLFNGISLSIHAAATFVSALWYSDVCTSFLMSMFLVVA